MEVTKGTLAGRVAWVTGASRGVGRGIALGLGAAGATVYLTGRTLEPDEAKPPVGGSLRETAQAIEARGGNAVPIRCDHADDAAVQAVVARIGEAHGRLDVLVNNVFAIPADLRWDQPFWKTPIRHWDLMHTIGLRSHYVASTLAMPWVLKSQQPLVVHVSSFGGRSYQIGVAYGVGKAGVDRLAADMAHELQAHSVPVVALVPGVVRTEWVLAHQAQGLPFSLDDSQSPEGVGRVVAALAADTGAINWTGRSLIVSKLAEHYGVDIA